MPFLLDTATEIILGDIIISSGVVQYDLGRRLPERFVCKNTLSDSLGKPHLEIRALLGKLEGRRGKMRLISNHLGKLQAELGFQA